MDPIGDGVKPQVSQDSEALTFFGDPRSPLDFVAIGHICWDQSRNQRRLGGAAFYAAQTAHRLGLNAGIVTAFGGDLEHTEAETLLDGISVGSARSRETTVFENRYEGEDRRQRILARARSIEPWVVEGFVGRFSLAADAITLFCPIAQELSLRLEPLSKHGLCGVAPQGFLRQWNASGEVSAVVWESSVESLEHVDLVSLSRDDIEGATKRNWTMDFPVRHLAVTDGAMGAQLRIGQHWVSIPTFDATLVDAIEPTGAGDAFAAAWLVALRAGKPTVEAARYATCVASLVVEGPLLGNLGTARDVDERLRLYREHVLGEPQTRTMPSEERAEFDAYCDDIETYFFRCKGRQGKLSPADFARVRRWYDGGLTTAEVLDGIGDAFRSQSSGRDRDDEEVNSLGYCESFIREAGREAVPEPETESEPRSE